MCWGLFSSMCWGVFTITAPLPPFPFPLQKKESLRAHKTFPGNRPSLSLLFPQLDAFTTGQLLALYEHRVFVQVSDSLGGEGGDGWMERVDPIRRDGVGRMCRQAGRPAD